LETLKAVARLRFFADYVKDRVDELSAFGVVTLGPVVTSSSLSKDEVVRTEELTERTSTDRVHGSRLKIEQDSTRDVSATSSFIEVHVDPLELKIRVSVVGSGWVNTVLISNNFPKLGTDLVTALSSL